MRRQALSLTALLTFDGVSMAGAGRLLPCALALVFLIAPQASAKEAGVMGGINITTLAFNPDVQRVTGPDRRVGAAASGFVTAPPMGGKLDLRLEGLFSQRARSIPIGSSKPTSVRI